MPLDITFTLSDSDLERFQAIIDQARESVQDESTAAEVEAAARALILETQKSELPEFIASRMIKLNVMINMINDEEWKLSDEDRKRVLSALAYLCNPDDLIPDHIPGLGFLDDAIYAEIIIREMRPEIELYMEFCDYRIAEEERRAARGEDIHINREEWLAEKRASLHANLRKRRAGGAGRGNWRLRFF
jgi:uncharacterized membrane protein YkvA (DUF1232 family)